MGRMKLNETYKTRAHIKPMKYVNINLVSPEPKLVPYNINY
jgi:hypothetical protein